MPKDTILPNGVHEVTTTRSGRTATHYIYQFHGHPGYIKEAIRRTPGVSFIGGSWMNGMTGGSKSVAVELESACDNLLKALHANYRAVCKEKGSNKNQHTREKVVAEKQPQQSRTQREKAEAGCTIDCNASLATQALPDTLVEPGEPIHEGTFASEKRAVPGDAEKG